MAFELELIFRSVNVGKIPNTTHVYCHSKPCLNQHAKDLEYFKDTDPDFLYGEHAENFWPDTRTV